MMGVFPDVLHFLGSLPCPVLAVTVALSLLIFCFAIRSMLSPEQPCSQFPVVALSEAGLSAKSSWFKCGKATIAKGVRTHRGPFQVITGTGPKIILPNNFAEELKSHPGLDVMLAFSKDFFSEYPGFESFKERALHPKFVPELVRGKLTQSLAFLMDDLVEETSDAVHDTFGEDIHWHAALLKQNVTQLVARLSSRAFLGKPLCRNQKWLDIAKGFTRHAFSSARLLRRVPPFVRPVAHWILPPCIKLRKDYRDAYDLITPEVERRKDEAHKPCGAGEKPSKIADTIGWMYELAGEKKHPVNYVAAQLGLALSAIHTTSEGITQVMLDICANPEIMQPLRDEIISVIGDDGFSKTSLYKLRLMDSLLKESQRLHPSNWVSMNRAVLSDIKLSDGTLLPAGSRIMIANKCFDPEIHADQFKFDPYRFLHKRTQHENENGWQHVSISSEHMAFGYGQHACPGRFFASTEMKIALCHLLMKYEWAPTEGIEASRGQFESNTTTSPDYKVMIRRREEEINLG